MDEQSQIRLFNDLSIEEEAKSHLSATAGYAKYVGISTIVLAAISFIQFIYRILKTSDVLGSLDYFFSFYGFIALFVQLLGMAIYYSIGLFTIRFANKMKSSIELLNQQDNDDAWHNLKMAYRICGLFMIICILLILFAMLVFGMYL